MATTTDQPVAFKPKKSVALSGTPAGNTALCTVGRTGNDLHYRGYDIADLAAHCEFEEVAYLLLRGKLPNSTELAAYKQKLTRLRGLPANVYEVLEQLPAATHPRPHGRATGYRARPFAPERFLSSGPRCTAMPVCTKSSGKWPPAQARVR